MAYMLPLSKFSEKICVIRSGQQTHVAVSNEPVSTPRHFIAYSSRSASRSGASRHAKAFGVVKKIAKDELQSETWLRSVARLSGKSYEAMRVGILEFLDTGVFNVSLANCASFLDPLIESWDIDLATFGTEIILEAHSWICKEI
jgi:hypothetical protein